MTKEQLTNATWEYDYHEHHGGMMIRLDPGPPMDKAKWMIIHPDSGPGEERFDTPEEAARFAWKMIGVVSSPE